MPMLVKPEPPIVTTRWVVRPWHPNEHGHGGPSAHETAEAAFAHARTLVDRLGYREAHVFKEIVEKWVVVKGGSIEHASE